MKIVYESRCLICDHIWITESCTEPCPICGELNDVYSEEYEDSEEYTKILVF